MMKLISIILNENGLLNEKDFEYLEGYCPWCGEGTMKHFDEDEGSYSLKCCKCGRIIGERDSDML